MEDNGVSRNIKVLRDMTTCAACMNMCKTPRRLPCLHVVCHECLEGLVNAAETINTIICSSCNQTTSIPATTADFPVCFLTNNLIDILNSISSSQTVQCYPCSESNDKSELSARWLCLMCGDCMCQNCKKLHDRYQKHHHCIDLQNTDSQNLQEIFVQIRSRYCSQHKKELEYLCDTCDEFMCVTCKLTSTKHKNHDTIFIKDESVIQQYKEKVQDFNQKCNESITQYSTCILSVRQRQETKNTDIDGCVNRIETRYQDMLQTLNSYKEDLTQQARTFRQECHAACSADIGQLTKQMEQLQCALESTQKIKQENAGVDIVICCVKSMTQFQPMLASTPDGKVAQDNTMLCDEFHADIADIKQVFGQLKRKSGWYKMANPEVSQVWYEITQFDKRDKLVAILNETGMDRTIVFVEQKRYADFLASYLSQSGFPSTSIHGDRMDREREVAMFDFKQGTAPILIATSNVAKGMNFPDVKHVINYDLPDNIDDYVRQIGHAGRSGHQGKATSFYDPDIDGRIARGLVKCLNDVEQEGTSVAGSSSRNTTNR